MAASFNPPHTRPVFRVLKTALREYMEGGLAANINVTTPPGQAHTATLAISGTVEVAFPEIMPPSVTVVLTQAAVTKGTQIAAVDPVTGAYTTTFPANTCAAGATVATVSSTTPVETTATPAFTLT